MANKITINCINSKREKTLKCSEKIIGNAGSKNFKIITKLPALNEKCEDIYSWVQRKVKSSLKQLIHCHSISSSCTATTTAIATAIAISICTHKKKFIEPILRSLWGVLGPILAEHTPNMGPSWAQDGPSWGQDGVKFGQVGSKNRLLEGLGAQEPPRASQDRSKPENRSNFPLPPGSVLGGFWGHVGFQEPLKGHSKGIQHFDRF